MKRSKDSMNHDCDPDCPWINHETNGCDRRHREERTCHDDEPGWRAWFCSECGQNYIGTDRKAVKVKAPNYCPKCGAKVVSE